MTESTCPKCKGQRYILTEEGRNKECDCVLRERALAYLTPTYASATYIKTFKADALRDQNIIMEGQQQSVFKTIAKSFLLNTGMTYQHETVTAHDVMQAYLTNTDTRELFRLTDVDLLILFLVHDPANRSYGQVLSSLIQSRDLKGKKTWIYTQNRLDSHPFSDRYGQEFVETIKQLKFKVLADSV